MFWFLLSRLDLFQTLLGSLHFAVVLYVAQHLLPLSDHVEVKLRKEGNVGDHDEDEEGVVVEGEVVLVR